MGKNIAYRSGVILLTILFLANSIGFSVDYHFCKGEVWSFSIMNDAKACEMGSESKSPLKKSLCCKKMKTKSAVKPSTATSSLTQVKCCVNQRLVLSSFVSYFSVEMSEDVEETSNILFLAKLQRYFYFAPLLSRKIVIPDSPPWTARAIYILNQTFLV